MKEVFSEDKDMGLKRRIVRRLYKVEKNKEYPRGLKYCVQYLYERNKEEWIEIIRIDNYLHQNNPGSHIHFFNKESVKWAEIKFEEAEKEAIRLGEKIINLLEGENGQNNNC